MICKVKKNTSISTMKKIIDQEGVFIIENYIGGTKLKKLYEETMIKINNEGAVYSFGRSYRGPNINSFDDNSEIKKLFTSQWMKDLYFSYTKNLHNEYGENVFSTFDYIITDKIANNGFLHYDRKSALKFFIYLTDVSKKNGAFYAAPRSNKYGKTHRINQWGTLKAHQIYDHNYLLKRLFFNKKYSSIKNKIELDELEENYDLIPIEANAGSLIVFDSDTLHKGGIIEENNLERLILRLHCYKT